MPKPRPDSQAFNDGIVDIFEVTNGAEPGQIPVEVLQPKGKLRFRERTVGIKRFTAFGQMDVDISRMIRTPKKHDVSTQDVAVINNVQYKIRQVQYPERSPRCMDISLERIEVEYAGLKQIVGGASVGDG